MSDPAVVRPYADGADEEGVRALLLACYGEGAVSAERFHQWHFGLGTALQGTVVAEGGGRIVGVQPMEVVDHRLEGRGLRAAVLTGVMVHPDWRRQGIFSRLIEACERRAWQLDAELVWTMPNDQSRPGFLKAGYSDPGRRRLMVWSPRPERLAARRLPAGVAGLAGRLAGWVIGGLPRVDDRWVVRETACLGEAEAGVADSFAASWPGLLQERSGSWLAWRFSSASGGSYRRFVASLVTGQPAAWAVTARERRDGLEAGYLLDLMSRDAAAGLAAGRAAMAALTEEGVDLVLSVVSSRLLVESCRRLGFVSVPSGLAPKRFFTVFKARADRAGLTTTLGTIGAWHQTLADWDTL